MHERDPIARLEGHAETVERRRKPAADRFDVGLFLAQRTFTRKLVL